VPMKLSLYYYFTIASFLVSLLLFKQPRTPLYLKLFTVLLGTTLLVDGYGHYLANHGRANHRIYSIFTSSELAFYLYVLSRIIQNPKMRFAIMPLLIFYAFVAIIDISIVQKNGFASFTYSLGSMVVIYYSIYYFFELFRNPKSIKLKNEPSFWICLGLLIYYCGTIPWYLLMVFLIKAPRNILNNLYIGIEVLNILLYTFFIIAFVCRVKKPNYTSQ